MKKIILLLSFVCCILNSMYPQVGINTTDPKGVFHVHTGTLLTTDQDVIVTSNGKVGIGTIIPTALLEIKTAGTAAAPIEGFMLQDGNQRQGAVLVSDNTGLATWATFTQPQYTLFTVGSGFNIAFNDANYYNTGSYVTLSPGRWALNVISITTGSLPTINTPILLSSTFADSATVVNSGGSFSSIKSSDIQGSGTIAGLCWSQNGHYMTITGSVIINNTSVGNKTYYFVAGGTSSFGVSVVGSLLNVGGTGWGELNIIAYRIPS